MITPIGISRKDILKNEIIFEDEATFNSKCSEIEGYEKYKNQITFKSFRCPHCGQTKASSLIVKLLIALQDHYPQKLYWGSAYRCEDYNAQIGGAGASFHMQGRAIDFGFQDASLNTKENMKTLASDVQMLINGDRMEQSVEKDNENWWGGLGWYDSWVHMDTRDYKYYYYSPSEFSVSRFDQPSPAIIFTPRLDGENLESATNGTYPKVRATEYYYDNVDDSAGSLRTTEYLNKMLSKFSANSKSEFKDIPLLGAIAYWQGEDKNTSYQGIVEVVNADKTEIIVSSIDLTGTFKLIKLNSQDWKPDTVVLPSDVTSLTFHFKGFIYSPMNIQGADGEGYEMISKDKPETEEEYIWYYLLGAFTYFKATQPEIAAAGVFSHIINESSSNHMLKGAYYNLSGKEEEIILPSYMTAENYIKFPDAHLFNYDRIGFGLLQHVQYQEKNALRQYTKDNLANLRLQLEFLLFYFKDNYQDEWDTLMKATDTGISTEAFYIFARAGKNQLSTFLTKRQNTAIKILGQYNVSQIDTTTWSYGETIEVVEHDEGQETIESIEPVGFTIPVFKSLHDCVCERCGQFYTKCTCSSIQEFSKYNPYLMYLNNKSLVQTVPQYEQTYSSKTTLLPKGIIIYYSPLSLAENLKVKKGSFYADYGQVFTNSNSPLTIKVPFHYCIGYTEKGDLISINTYDPLLALPKGGIGQKGTLDNDYLHILFCAKNENDNLYNEFENLLSSLIKCFNISVDSNSFFSVGNIKVPTIISIDEACDMGLAINSLYKINNFGPWSKIINNIRKSANALINPISLYYVYDYNTKYSSPLLLGQFYELDLAKQLYFQNPNNYGFFTFDMDGTKIWILPTTGKQIETEIQINTLDKWGDNSPIEKPFYAYKILPVTPDEYDGYFIIQNDNQELGLIKLAQR